MTESLTLSVIKVVKNRVLTDASIPYPERMAVVRTLVILTEELEKIHGLQPNPPPSTSPEPRKVPGD